jgi:flagellar biosynthesis component FlhA
MGLSSSRYVTRSELDSHIQHQQMSKDDIIQEIRRDLESTITEQLAAKDQQIQELRQELASTQMTLMQLELRCSDGLPISSRQATMMSPTPDNRISDAAIEAVVHDILADPELNLSFVPDAIEAKIYRKLIRHVLLSLAKMTDQIRLDMLGHQIRLVLEPRPPN